MVMINQNRSKYFLPLFCLLFGMSSLCYAQDNEKTSAKTTRECDAVQGYWYRQKCWDYEDDEDGIAIEDIDRRVDERMAVFNKTRLSVNSRPIPVDLVSMAWEDNVLAVFSLDGKLHAVSMEDHGNWESEKSASFDVKADLIQGDIFDEAEDEITLAKGNLSVKGPTDGKFEVSGVLEGASKTFDIKLSFYDAVWGAGSSVLEVKGDKAYLSGDLGYRGYYQFKKMIAEHPEVRTVVLTYVSGSIDDAFNMHTGRIIREAGLTTEILSDSEIYSGGVDLFTAGKERIVEQGAIAGVHSWCCVNDLPAGEVPKDHPAHQFQIAYFKMTMGDELGEDFYFFTLESGPSGEMYNMKDDEIKQWGVATQFVDKK